MEAEKNIRIPLSPATILLVSAFVFTTLTLSGTASAETENNDEKIQVKIFVVLKDPLSPYGLLGLHLYKELKNNQELNRDYIFELTATAGSLSALLNLDTENNAIAIAQSDVLYHYLNGNHPNFPVPKMNSNVRAVARLFPEFVYLSTPRNSANTNVLQYVRVCGGREGSGTLVTAINLRNVLHASWETLHYCREVCRQGSNEVESEEFLRIDTLSPSRAMLSQSLAPTNSATEDLIKCDAKHRQLFLPLTSARVMANAFPGTYRTIGSNHKLFPGASGNTNENTDATIAVDAVLVATKQIDDIVVDALRQILLGLDAQQQHENSDVCAESTQDDGQYCEPVALGAEGDEDAGRAIADSIDVEHIHAQTAFTEFEHRLWPDNHWTDKELEDREKNAYEGLPIAMHGSLRVDKLDRISKQIARRITPKVLAWMLYLPLGLYLLVYLNALRTRHDKVGDAISALWGAARHNFKPLLFVASVVLIHFVIAVLIWLSEYHEASGGPESKLAFAGIIPALKFLFDHITDTPNDVVLHSTYSSVWLGILKAGYAVTGIVLFLGLTHNFWSWLMRDNKSNYVVVVGKGNAWHAVKKEFEGIRKPYICVVKNIQNVLSKHSFHPDLIKPSDDRIKPASADDIARQAEAFIVLSDEQAAIASGVSDPDLWVASTVEIINGWRSNRKKSFDIIAEVQRPESEAVIRAAGATEAICVERFGGELIVQSVKKPQIVQLFEELVRTSDNNNEIYFDEIDSNQGKFKNFSEIVHEFHLKESAPLERRIPIGLMRREGKTLLLNPTGDEGNLVSGDKLIVIARTTN